MRKTFQVTLLIVFGCAFAITLGLALTLRSAMAEKQVAQVIPLVLEEIRGQIREAERDAARLRELAGDGMLLKARAIAEIIAGRPQAEWDLSRLAARFQLEYIDVVDGRGMVAFSSTPSRIGFDFADRGDTRLLVAGAKNPTFETIHRPELGEESELWAATTRPGESGLVRAVGKNVRFEDAFRLTGLESLGGGARIGRGGGVLLYGRNGVIGSAGPFAPEALKTLTVGKQQIPDREGRPYLVITTAEGPLLLTGYLPESELRWNQGRLAWGLAAVHLVLFLAVYFLVTGLLRREVFEGLESANRALTGITEGDLSIQVEVRNNPEFCRLSDHINTMVVSLKDAIRREAKKIEEELDFAHTVQQSVLPVFEDVPPHRRDSVELGAWMNPARMVGGDFYDFFPLGENRFGLLVADVSGKGISAAMMMMQAKAMLRETAEKGVTPGELFSEINRKLCENNTESMFATALFVLADLDSGRVTFVNAGHTVPLVQRAAGESFEWLKLPVNFVLGGDERTRFVEYEWQMAPDAKLFLYTDGLIDLESTEGELFSAEKIVETLNQSKLRNASAREMLRLMRREVNTWQGSAPQADDIAMLVFAIDPPSRGLTIPAEVKFLESARKYVFDREAIYDLAFTEPMRFALDLLLEELFVNIANYAYLPGTGQVKLRCFLDGEFLVMEFTDWGMAFDPLEYQGRRDGDNTRPGGHGINLCKKYADGGIAYRRDGNRNVLTLRKKVR